MKTKANKELFDRWNSLGEIVKSNSAIVQNDLELDDEEIEQFTKEVGGLLFDIAVLAGETSDYLKTGKLK